MDERALLRKMFDAAVAAAAPDLSCRRICPRRPAGARWWSAPARPRRRWPARLKRIGRPAVRPCRHALRPRRRQAGSRWSRRPSGSRRRRPARRAACWTWCAGSAPTIWCWPDLRRRLGAAVPAGAGLTLADKQAGQSRPAAARRADRRNELRAQASLGDQGRPPGRRGLARRGCATLIISDVPGDDPP